MFTKEFDLVWYLLNCAMMLFLFALWLRYLLRVGRLQRQIDNMVLKRIYEMQKPFHPEPIVFKEEKILRDTGLEERTLKESLGRLVKEGLVRKKMIGTEVLYETDALYKGKSKSH